MSLILDALKKMEQDKARRQTKSMELGPAILRERTSASGSRWRTPALLACAVVTTAVSMYLVMNPAPKAPEPAIEPAPVVRTAPAPTAIVPPLPPNQDRVEEEPAPRAEVSAPATGSPAMTAPPPSVTAAPPVNLMVNGIAWQEERSGRRAVVNGILVAEGDTIAGFRIRQIHADKVIFTSGSQTVEILQSTPFH